MAALRFFYGTTLRRPDIAGQIPMPRRSDHLPTVLAHEEVVIEIDSFVPRQQIDQRFFDTPYYVAPNPVAQEAFAVIREAMRLFRCVGNLAASL
jgi:Ku70/Ku80 beta-barrel domain